MPEAEADVLVIGAGWAGLAAAVTLTASGRNVHLIEAARRPGGRARGLDVDGQTLDNGQHLLTGACRETLILMRQVGADPERLLQRAPLGLDMRDGQTTRLGFRAARLHAPWHLLAGLLRARGLSGRQRLAVARFARRLPRLVLDDDCPVQRLLRREDQDAELCRRLWNPLCLAALNTGAAEASARLFVAVLRETLAGPRQHSDWLFPAPGLSALLPDPALEFIRARGGRVSLGRRVQALLWDEQGIRGAATRDGPLAARRVILATDARNGARLLADVPGLEPTRRQLAALETRPIATLYARVESSVRAQARLTGLLEGPGQWLFDHHDAGRPGFMALVIGAPAAGGAREALEDAALDQLRRALPGRPRVLWHRLLVERHATFAAGVNIDARRPDHRTALPGLWLAGDHTATGLPATLEGAVRSGRACAARLLADELVHSRP